MKVGKDLRRDGRKAENDAAGKARKAAKMQNAMRGSQGGEHGSGSGRLSPPSPGERAGESRMAETLGMKSFAPAGGPSGLTERTKMQQSAQNTGDKSETTPATVEQPASALKPAGTDTTIYSVPSRLMPAHDPVVEVDANIKARRDELERTLHHNKKIREQQRGR